MGYTEELVWRNLIDVHKEVPSTLFSCTRCVNSSKYNDQCTDTLQHLHCSKHATLTDTWHCYTTFSYFNNHTAMHVELERKCNGFWETNDDNALLLLQTIASIILIDSIIHAVYSNYREWRGRGIGKGSEGNLNLKRK